MGMKAHWNERMHDLRSDEFKRIFNRFKKKEFQKTLELGAGDGFQTKLLKRYSICVTAADYNYSRLKKTRGVDYMQLDAEEAGKKFKKSSFDLVYSSNMLEHLNYPDKSLRGIHRILKDDGITIHTMPTPFWKFCQMVFHYPNLMVLFIQNIRDLKGRMKQSTTNNPKSSKHSILRQIIWPVPHGAYNSNIIEFIKFRKKRWLHEFDKSGFVVIKVIKGPISSGYRFGFDTIRKILEKLGFASVYIYVAVKRGKVSRYAKNFD